MSRNFYPPFPPVLGLLVVLLGASIEPFAVGLVGFVSCVLPHISPPKAPFLSSLIHETVLAQLFYFVVSKVKKDRYNFAKLLDYYLKV